MTAVIFKVCGDIASSALQFEAWFNVQMSPEKPPGPPELPGDADGMCCRRALPRLPVVATHPPTLSPLQANDKYRHWRGRFEKVGTAVPVPFPLQGLCKMKAPVSRARHCINLRNPQRAEKPSKENNVRIISFQLVIFWCQHHISGTAWKHRFLQLLCLGAITHAPSTALLLLLLIKYQLKYCLLNFVHWFLGSCWQK